MGDLLILRFQTRIFIKSFKTFQKKKNSKQNTSQDKFLKQMLGFGYSHYMDGIS
jgi:hypothetical protein